MNKLTKISNFLGNILSGILDAYALIPESKNTIINLKYYSVSLKWKCSPNKFYLLKIIKWKTGIKTRV